MQSGFAIERHKPCRIAVRLRVRRSFLGERLVFRVAVDQLDVLINCAGAVFHPIQSRDQAAPDGGDPFDALNRRQLRLFQALNGGELVIPKTAIVLCLKVRVGHGREIAGAQRIGREQAAQQSTCPVELARVGRDASRFQRESPARSGVACLAASSRMSIASTGCRFLT